MAGSNEEIVIIDNTERIVQKPSTKRKVSFTISIVLVAADTWRAQFVFKNPSKVIMLLIGSVLQKNNFENQIEIDDDAENLINLSVKI